jgi:hypothetical protein
MSASLPSRGPAVGTGPLWAARVLAALAALGWGFFFFGLIDLLVVILQDERFHEAYLLETGWGLLYTVLVAAPLVAFVARPRSPVLLGQLTSVAVAVAACAVLIPAWALLIPGVGLLATAILLARLSRQRLRFMRNWSARRVGAVRGALLLPALAAAIGYAVEMIGASRAGVPDDVTWGLHHLPMQAAFAIAVPTVAALGAGSREPGWRICVWSAAVSAVWLGVVSIVYPQHLGSLGGPLGLAAVAWGIAFLAANTRR